MSGTLIIVLPKYWSQRFLPFTSSYQNCANSHPLERGRWGMLNNFLHFLWWTKFVCVQKRDHFFIFFRSYLLFLVYCKIREAVTSMGDGHPLIWTSILHVGYADWLWLNQKLQSSLSYPMCSKFWTEDKLCHSLAAVVSGALWTLSPWFFFLPNNQHNKFHTISAKLTKLEFDLHADHS